jgi:hypothetical protein
MNILKKLIHKTVPFQISNRDLAPDRRYGTPSVMQPLLGRCAWVTLPDHFVEVTSIFIFGSRNLQVTGKKTKVVP